VAESIAGCWYTPFHTVRSSLTEQVSHSSPPAPATAPVLVLVLVLAEDGEGFKTDNEGDDDDDGDDDEEEYCTDTEVDEEEESPGVCPDCNDPVPPLLGLLSAVSLGVSCLDA
jgi:hypothetical protein